MEGLNCHQPHLSIRRKRGKCFDSKILIILKCTKFIEFSARWLTGAAPAESESDIGSRLRDQADRSHLPIGAYQVEGLLQLVLCSGEWLDSGM